MLLSPHGHHQPYVTLFRPRPCLCSFAFVPSNLSTAHHPAQERRGPGRWVPFAPRASRVSARASPFPPASLVMVHDFTHTQADVCFMVNCRCLLTSTVARRVVCHPVIRAAQERLCRPFAAAAFPRPVPDRHSRASYPSARTSIVLPAGCNGRKPSARMRAGELISALIARWHACATIEPTRPFSGPARLHLESPRNILSNTGCIRISQMKNVGEDAFAVETPAPQRRFDRGRRSGARARASRRRTRAPNSPPSRDVGGGWRFRACNAGV